MNIFIFLSKLIKILFIRLRHSGSCFGPKKYFNAVSTSHLEWNVFKEGKTVTMLEKIGFGGWKLKECGGCGKISYPKSDLQCHPGNMWLSIVMKNNFGPVWIQVKSKHITSLFMFRIRGIWPSKSNSERSDWKSKKRILQPSWTWIYTTSIKIIC